MRSPGCLETVQISYQSTLLVALLNLFLPDILKEYIPKILPKLTHHCLEIKASFCQLPSALHLRLLQPCHAENVFINFLKKSVLEKTFSRSSQS